MPQKNVPQPSNAKATEAEVVFAKDLATRTLQKLKEEVEAQNDEAALRVLDEAFREANCDHSLFDCHFWDLAGNTRIHGLNAEGEPVVIPATSLPPVGTVINFSNITYYIASHKAQPEESK